MRISDWSSDVCSSDLGGASVGRRSGRQRPQPSDALVLWAQVVDEHAGHRGDVERPGVPHLLEVSPVLGAVEERLEDGEVVTRQERQLVVGEGLPPDPVRHGLVERSEEHTSELQSLMRISYAVFCLKKKNKKQKTH